MKITDRLKGIVSFIKPPCSVADIGTDHAYLPIYLAQNFECDRLIASDAKIGPYRTALKNIKGFGLEDKVEVRLGSGLSVLESHEVKTVVMAGMGGNTISEILASAQKISRSITKFILQPMNARVFLRSWLLNNQFRIKDEGLAKENDRFYEIIVAKSGQERIEDEFLLEIGPRLREKKPEHYKEFLIAKKENWQQILNNLPQKEVPKIVDKRNNFKSKLAKIQEVIKCL